MNPELRRETRGGLSFWSPPHELDRGVLVAFSERCGGVSRAPFASLNLAGHVGDDPAAVDENRGLFLSAVGIGELCDRLVTGEQVHGERIACVGEADAGRGAFVSAGRGAIPRTDALLSLQRGVPLMLMFADCVPVVLVAPRPAVGVVHAGWRGALAGLPGSAVRELCRASGCSESDVTAYIGPHIHACHYMTSSEIMSQFVNTFGTFARAESGGFDLGVVVARSLTDAGVPTCNVAALGTCTAEATDRFFSYRAEGGQTGRHAALACIL